MNLFIAASYSSHVNYETRLVKPEYKEWLEGNLETLERFGHTVFCALRADGYKINNSDPAQAFNLDIDNIRSADGMLAFVDSKSVSAGVQTEIGIAVALEKRVVLAHTALDSLAYFNNAIVRAGKATTITIPFSNDPFATT